MKVFAPFDRAVIAEIEEHTKEQAEAALQKARLLFLDQAGWLPPWQRVKILEKTAELLAARVEELTLIAAREGGKPYTDSKIEVERAINGVRIAAAEIAQIRGEQIPMEMTKGSEDRLAFTIREPIGVVFSISAFNHPLNLIIHQTVTAFAAGCPFIIKPATATPLSCLRFMEIFAEAGLPEGWGQVLICNNDIAESVATDKRVGYLSFIGSAKVGWYLRSKLAEGTRCALEHGGAAPVIVESDADIGDLIPTLLKGGFYHAGQVCVSVQRIFVHQDICDSVAAALAEGASKLAVGNPLDHATEVGPLIAAKEVDRVHDWIREAVQAGAKLLCGGKKISDTCYAPTVLLDPPDDALVSTREIFGPVVCVYRFLDRDDAIRRANALDLHFQASVFTKNIDVAFECIKKLDATGVMVNDHTAFRVDWMPFGGRDASGLGMGGIPCSIHEMTREKMMVIKTSR